MLGLADVQGRKVYPPLGSSDLGLQQLFSMTLRMADMALVDVPSRSRRMPPGHQGFGCGPDQLRIGVRRDPIVKRPQQGDARSELGHCWRRLMPKTTRSAAR